MQDPGTGGAAALGAQTAAVSTTAQTTQNSTTLTTIAAGTSALVVGQAVAGATIPSGAYVTAITSGTTATLNVAALASASNVSVSFALTYQINNASGPLPASPASAAYLTQTITPARSVDATVSQVTSIPSGNQTLNVTPVFGLVADYMPGDVVLVINQQGDGTYSSNVGMWEFAQVASVGTASLTLASPLANSYGQSPGSDSPLGNQVVCVYRVPEYGQITLPQGDNISPSAWAGAGGRSFLLFWRSR